MQITRKYATTVRAFSLSLTLFPKCCFRFIKFIPTKDFCMGDGPSSWRGFRSFLFPPPSTRQHCFGYQASWGHFYKVDLWCKKTNCFLTVTSHPVLVPLYFHTDWDRFWSFPHFFTLNKEHISLRWFSSIYKYKQFSVPRNGINSRIRCNVFI